MFTTRTQRSRRFIFFWLVSVPSWWIFVNASKLAPHDLAGRRERHRVEGVSCAARRARRRGSPQRAPECGTTSGRPHHLECGQRQKPVPRPCRAISAEASSGSSFRRDTRTPARRNTASKQNEQTADPVRLSRLHPQAVPIRKLQAGGTSGLPPLCPPLGMLRKRRGIGGGDRGLGRQHTGGRTSRRPSGADEFGHGCLGVRLPHERGRFLIGHRNDPPLFHSAHGS
jgi:hypothetical protein